MSHIQKTQTRASHSYSLSQWLGTSLLALASLGALSGCGQQPFVVTASVESAQAPGSMVIPAKVDVLLVEDDTGSMNEIYPLVESEIQTILPTLQANGWDYHFATIPLTTYRSLTQVAASQYDSNWGSSWLPPFPGAVQYDDSNTVASYLFRTPDNYSDFLDRYSIQNTNGKEWGFDNMINSLYSYQSNGSRYLRDDAMLVVIMVGNGNDTSRVNFCTRADGVVLPCDQLGMPACTSFSQWGATGQTCSSGTLSFNYYKGMFAGLKSSSSMIRFYAVVSNETITHQTCYGANAGVGARYQQMAAAFQGKSYDLCGSSNAVADSLQAISSDLQNVRLSLETAYLPISQEPNVSTIIVTRNDGVIIPQSSTNGWTYAGYGTFYQIDSPVPMDQFTGYAIQLHGNYKLTGSQSATVSYTPANLHNSN